MKLGKTLAVNSVYRILNIVVVFLITILLSRLTGVAGYGLLSLMIANATIFNLLSGLGADAGIGYHTATDDLPVTKIISFLFSIIFLQLVLLSIAEIISFSLTGHLWLLRSTDVKQWWLGFVFFISISLVEKFTALFNGKQLFARCNKILLVSNALMLMIFIILWFWFDVGSVYFYISVYVLFNLLQALFLIISWRLIRGNKFSWNKFEKKDVSIFFSYSLMAFITNVIQFFAYRIDYWFVDHYRGEQELGWYSLAVRTAQMFWILPLLFASVIFPSVAGNKQQYDDGRLLALIRGLNFLNIISGVILFFASTSVIPFLFGTSYNNSIELFQILLPGVILFCIATILAAYFAGMKKLEINFWGSFLCFITILLLDITLIPSIGMKGAAIASSVGYSATAIYFSIAYILQRKIPFWKLIVPIKSDWKYIIDILRKNNKEQT